MKINRFSILFLSVFLIECNSHPAKRVFTFDQAILQEGIPELVIACGTVAVADAFLFQSSNSDSCIVGVVQCVSLYGNSFFKKGAKYSLQVTQKNITGHLKNYIVQNPYEGKGYSIYLITQITKVK